MNSMDIKPTEVPPVANRLIRQIHVYTRVQWVLAITLLGAGALFYFGVYRPQRQQVDQLAWETNTKRLELQTDRSQTDRLPRETLELATLKKRLAGFKKLPSDPQLGQFMHDINQASQLAGLQKLVVEPQLAKRDELFSDEPINLSFTGDFNGVWKFIGELEDMQRLTRLRELSIQSIDARRGAVDVKLSVNIYYGETM